MKIDSEKFLALTAALAVGTLIGCSSSEKSASPGVGDSGNGGSSQGTGGGGGKGGASGGSDKDASAGGKTDAGGKGGKGGADAGDSGPVLACLGDVAPAFPDAGAESFEACAIIPYYSKDCQGPDAGAESLSLPPTGSSLCYLLEYSLRPGVFHELVSCLASLKGDVCADAHTGEAYDCYAEVVGRACDRPKVDAGADPCTKVTGCSGVSMEDCHNTLRAFSDESLEFEVLPCLDSVAKWDGGACDDEFWACIPPILGN